MDKNYQHRIALLRRFCVPERVYHGRTPFDDQSWTHLAQFNDVEELITDCRPNTSNDGYGGVFRRYGETGKDYYAESFAERYAEIITAEIGDSRASQRPIQELEDARNIEAHIFIERGKGNNTLYRVFFLPAIEYVRELERNPNATYIQGKR